MTDQHANQIISLLKEIKEELSNMKMHLDSIESNTSSVSSNTYSVDELFERVIKAIEEK